MSPPQLGISLGLLRVHHERSTPLPRVGDAMLWQVVRPPLAYSGIRCTLGLACGQYPPSLLCAQGCLLRQGNQEWGLSAAKGLPDNSTCRGVFAHLVL